MVGNPSIVAFPRGAARPEPCPLARGCLAVVLVGGVVMKVAQDGHGTGILAGAAATSLLLARRQQRERVEEPVDCWLP